MESPMIESFDINLPTGEAATETVATENYNNDVGKEENSILDALIDLLPFELNFSGGYEFCGAGTHLDERLQLGNQGINPLDKACLQHDLAYNSDKDRRKADWILADKAFARMLSFDAEPSERTAALVTDCCMVSKITFEKFFDRIQKLLGINKKKNKNIKIENINKKKSKKLQSNSNEKKIKKQKLSIIKNKNRKNGKNAE